jgi:hypothetical protein
MDFSVLPGVIGGIAGAMIVGWLVSKIPRDAPSAAGGVKVLRHHKFLNYLGWLCGILFAVFYVGSVVVTLMGREGLATLIIGSCVFLPLTILSIVLVVQYRKCTITFDENRVTAVPLMGEPISFTWSDVKRVTFSHLAGWYVIKLLDGRRIRVSPYMVGTVEFMQTIADNSGVTIPAASLPNGTRLEIQPRRNADGSER